MQQLNFFDPIEDQIRLATGNQKLVAYGIQNEESDFRAHVAYLAMRVYVFPTDKAQRLLERADDLNLKLASARQQGIETARGYLVPLSYIENLQEVVIPPDVYTEFRIDIRDSTTVKGLKAASIVWVMLHRDMIPLPVRVNHADSKALQIKGTDIMVNSVLKLQVKCDLRGGDRKYNGTGNLFFQLSECNPFRRY